MACTPCTFIQQIVINILLLGDHALNTLLLGDPNETVSMRTARARASGSKSATAFCTFLTFAARTLSFNGVRDDHCDLALSDARSTGRELWDWKTGRLRAVPINEVTGVEMGGDA